MNRKALLKVIALGNQAKDFGDYGLANLAFAVLFEEYFTGKLLKVVLETADPTGARSEETHYDLIRFETRRAANDSLCIPLPMLNKGAAVRLLKTAWVAERREHCRKKREIIPGEVESLQEQLSSIVGPDRTLAYYEETLKEILQ